jgi:hypothetical protein
MLKNFAKFLATKQGLGVSLLGTAGLEVGDGGTCRVFLKPGREAAVKFD